MQTLTLTASDENLPAVNDFIHSAIESYAPTDQAVFALDLAIEELFVNIAHYAYTPRTGEATISCSVAGDPPAVTVTLSDSGTPYNPLLRPDPDVTQRLEDRRIGGMGIYLTKKYMDSISYSHTDGKNVITVSKSLR